MVNFAWCVFYCVCVLCVCGVWCVKWGWYVLCVGWCVFVMCYFGVCCVVCVLWWVYCFCGVCGVWCVYVKCFVSVFFLWFVCGVCVVCLGVFYGVRILFPLVCRVCGLCYVSLCVCFLYV